MVYYQRFAPKKSVMKVDFPLRADQVSECPPHHWMVASGWQQCKKCELRQQIVQPQIVHSYRLHRVPSEPAA